MRRIALTAILAGTLLVPAQGALAFGLGDLQNAVEGAAQAAKAFTITPEQEAQIGQEIADDVLKETPALKNAAVQAYVKGVGDKLVAEADVSDDFVFTVIQSDEVNAFAAPAGHVFVTTGALRSMKSESQLAGVLGHEVAHVAKHHGIDAIKKQMIAAGIATAAVKDQGYLVQQAADLGFKMMLKGFDRAAESEADEYGQKYAASAGYDPKGIEEFLTTLSQQGEAPIWLMPVSSHPRSDDRVAALASKRPAAPEGAIVGKEAFQKQVLSVLGAAGTKK